MEDLLEFSMSGKKDYGLYKSLRHYVNKNLKDLQHVAPQLSTFQDVGSEAPIHLTWDEIWDKYEVIKKTSDNSEYQNITNCYFKIDFKGHKSDEKFQNMIDDALHAFYAAHCDAFVTIDDRCHYKATETYRLLGIKTITFKPDEFIKNFE